MNNKQLQYCQELTKYIDFKKNVYALNDNENKILKEYAKKYNYHCKDNGSTIGTILEARFYLFMQKIYRKLNK